MYIYIYIYVCRGATDVAAFCDGVRRFGDNIRKVTYMHVYTYLYIHICIIVVAVLLLFCTDTFLPGPYLYMGDSFYSCFVLFLLKYYDHDHHHHHHHEGVVIVRGQEESR
jgi:hypothetical protein